MKKLIACVVALFLIFALFGCGGAEDKFDDAEVPVEQVTNEASEPPVVEAVEPEASSEQVAQKAPKTSVVEAVESEAPSERVEQKASTPVSQPDKAEVVYITDTGTKYHKGSCRWLKNSKIEILKEEAKAKGYEACGTCH